MVSLPFPYYSPRGIPPQTQPEQKEKTPDTSIDREWDVGLCEYPCDSKSTTHSIIDPTKEKEVQGWV